MANDRPNSGDHAMHLYFRQPQPKKNLTDHIVGRQPSALGHYPVEFSNDSRPIFILYTQIWLCIISFVTALDSGKGAVLYHFMEL